MNSNETRQTVVIVDPNRLSREGMIRLFDDTDFDVIGQVASITDFVEKAYGTDEPSMLVVNAPNRDNETHAKMEQLRADKPKMKLVVLVDDLDRRVLADYFGAGVDGYLLKDVSPQALLASLELVMAGERVFSSGLIPMVIEQAAVNGTGDQIGRSIEGVDLSNRETEISASSGRRRGEQGDRQPAQRRRSDRQGSHQAHSEENSGAKPHTSSDLGH